MTPEAYRKRIAALGLSQEAAGELFGFDRRTGQNWAKKGPPRPVAMLLIAIRTRTTLERLANRA